MTKNYRSLIFFLIWIIHHYSALSENQLSPFEKVTQEPAFIDKSNLIKNFIATALQTNIYNALITCPSRFGKSSNLDMLKRFLDHPCDEKVKTENHNLFKNPKLKLHIATDEDFFKQHFAKYSVLFLNFSVDSSKKTHEEIIAVVNDQLKQVFARYSWLYKEPPNPPADKTKRTYPNAEHKEFFEKIQSGKANSTDYEKSLRILAEDLSNYLDGERDIVLLIDDYDAPIRQAMEMQANGSSIIPIIRSLLANALSKDSIVINYAMVVGTYAFDGFNDTIQVFSFLEEHKFTEYFGFDLKDLQVLHQTDRFGFKLEESNKLQQFYNGYQTKFDKVRLYNPASVAMYYREKKFENYWPKTGYTVNLMERLRNKLLREKIENLLLNRVFVFKQEAWLTPSLIDTVEEIIGKNDSRTAFKSNQVPLYLSTLFQHGYFSFVEDSSPKELRCFRIPNQEVRLQLSEDLFKYFQCVVQGWEEKSSNVFKSIRDIIEGNPAEEEAKKSILTALRDIMDPLYALGKYDYEQLTLDFHSFIYTSLVHGAKPEEKFDVMELSSTVDKLVGDKIKEDSGKVDISIWSKDKTVLLYIDMKTYPRFKTLQDAINYAKTFRPSRQSTTKPKYVKVLIIYLNISKKVEVGFCPRMEYVDGKWISTPEPTTPSLSTSSIAEAVTVEGTSVTSTKESKPGQGSAEIVSAEALSSETTTKYTPPSDYIDVTAITKKAA